MYFHPAFLIQINSMNENILDNNFQNPEELKTYAHASFWTRVGASIIDSLIFLPLIWLMFHNALNWKNYYLDLLISIGSLAYKPLMEGVYGATIGKMVIKIKVVSENYEPIDMDNSFVRNVFYVTSYVLSILTSYYVFHATGFDEVTNFVDFSQFTQANDKFATLNSLMGFVLIFSGVMVAFDRMWQSLHDKIAKTYVIEV